MINAARKLLLYTYHIRDIMFTVYLSLPQYRKKTNMAIYHKAVTAAILIFSVVMNYGCGSERLLNVAGFSADAASSRIYIKNLKAVMRFDSWKYRETPGSMVRTLTRPDDPRTVIMFSAVSTFGNEENGKQYMQSFLDQRTVLHSMRKQVGGYHCLFSLYEGPGEPENRRKGYVMMIVDPEMIVIFDGMAPGDRFKGRKGDIEKVFMSLRRTE